MNNQGKKKNSTGNNSRELVFYFILLFSILFSFNFYLYNCIWLCRAPNENNEVMLAKCHYRQAKIDGAVFNLYDDAYVKVFGFVLKFTFCYGW